MRTLRAATLPGTTRSSCPGASSPSATATTTAPSSPASSASTRCRRASSMRDHDEWHQDHRQPAGAAGGRRRDGGLAGGRAADGQCHRDRHRTGRQHVLQPGPHRAADVGALRPRRRDRRVGHRRDAVAERRAAEDRAEQRGRMHTGARAGRIEQRSADQDRPEAGPGRGRDHGAGQEGRRHVGAAAQLECPRAPHQRVHEAARRQHAAERAGQQPGDDHQQHQRLGHALDDGLRIASPIADQQPASRERGKEQRPEAALVGGPVRGQPGRAGEEHRQRGQRAGDAAVEREIGSVGSGGRHRVRFAGLEPGPRAPPARRV